MFLWEVPLTRRDVRCIDACRARRLGAPCIPVHNWQKVPLRAAGAQEGALCPLLRITPAGGCLRMPATANKFVHILWKNLICDNVAAAQFCA